VDSARLNLASTFTNGFVNLGFCCDKLMGGDANKWFYKNKDHGEQWLLSQQATICCDRVRSAGMMSAAASMGLIYRWDVDGGLSAIDKYLYTTEESIKVWIQRQGISDNSGVAGRGLARRGHHQQRRLPRLRPGAGAARRVRRRQLQAAPPGRQRVRVSFRRARAQLPVSHPTHQAWAGLRQRQ